MADCCSVTLMSMKAQSGFIHTDAHPFSVFVTEQKDAFTSKHEWDLSRGIWYCCQVNKQCSVAQRQLCRPSDTPFEQSSGSILAKISDDLFGYCPWHTYTPVQYVVSHPVSLPLPMGQVLHAFSTRAWLVLVCQLHLDGPMQRFSCNHLPDWSSRINALTSPALTIVLTMLLWCCFFCRDCGGSGKRKSGKDLKIFLQPSVDRVCIYCLLEWYCGVDLWHC